MIVVPAPDDRVQLPYHLFYRQAETAPDHIPYALLDPLHRAVRWPGGTVPFSLRFLAGGSA